MMELPDLKKLDVNDIKSKPVKFIVTIFILLFFLILIGFLISQSVRYFTDQYVNVFGWEPNGPPKQMKADTVGIATPPTLNPKVDSFSTPRKVVSKGPEVKLLPILQPKKILKPSPLKQETVKNDTVVKQQTTVTGDHAHVISGNNNSVGVNGDVNFNKEKELTDRDKTNLWDLIEKEKQRTKSNPNCFIVSMTMNSNGQKLAGQITEFLKSAGYKFKGSGIIFPGQGMLDDVTVNIRDSCIQIAIGYLK